MRTVPVPSGKSLAFGPRLRAARISLGLTLDQLAASCDLSKGFLSRIERDDASPSVATLVALCEVMKLDVGSLFTPPVLTTVRRRDAQGINLGGSGVRDSVMTARHESRVQLIHSLIEPGGHGGDDFYTIGCDVEVAYVLKGSVEIKFAHGSELLEAGDALTFPGKEPHTWANASGTEPAEVIWTVCPAPSLERH